MTIRLEPERRMTERERERARESERERETHNADLCITPLSSEKRKKPA